MHFPFGLSARLHQGLHAPAKKYCVVEGYLAPNYILVKYFGFVEKYCHIEIIQPTVEKSLQVLPCL